MAEMSRESRAMLLNVLWHHQGGSSPVGQPLRKLLGIEPHAHLTDEQVREAKWIDGLLSRAARGVETSDGPKVTDAMVDAYLQANDAYWKRTDELPTPPNKWRTGTAREATRESLRAALAACGVDVSGEVDRG